MPLNSPFDVLSRKMAQAASPDTADTDALTTPAVNPDALEARYQQNNYAQQATAFAQQQADAKQATQDAENQAAIDKANAENAKAQGVLTEEQPYPDPTGKVRVRTVPQTNDDGTTAYKPEDLGIQNDDSGAPYRVTRDKWGNQNWTSPYDIGAANYKLAQDGTLLATAKGKGTADLPAKDVTDEDAPYNDPKVIAAIQAREAAVVKQAATQQVQEGVGADAVSAASDAATARIEAARTKNDVTALKPLKDSFDPADAAHYTTAAAADQAQQSAAEDAAEKAAAARAEAAKAKADPVGYLRAKNAATDATVAAAKPGVPPLLDPASGADTATSAPQAPAVPPVVPTLDVTQTPPPPAPTAPAAAASASAAVATPSPAQPAPAPDGSDLDPSLQLQTGTPQPNDDLSGPMNSHFFEGRSNMRRAQAILNGDYDPDSPEYKAAHTATNETVNFLGNLGANFFKSFSAVGAALGHAEINAVEPKPGDNSLVGKARTAVASLMKMNPVAAAFFNADDSWDTILKNGGFGIDPVLRKSTASTVGSAVGDFVGQTDQLIAGGELNPLKDYQFGKDALGLGLTTVQAGLKAYNDSLQDGATPMAATMQALKAGGLNIPLYLAGHFASKIAPTLAGKTTNPLVRGAVGGASALAGNAAAMAGINAAQGQPLTPDAGGATQLALNSILPAFHEAQVPDQVKQAAKQRSLINATLGMAQDQVSSGQISREDYDALQQQYAPLQSSLNDFLAQPKHAAILNQLEQTPQGSTQKVIDATIANERAASPVQVADNLNGGKPSPSRAVVQAQVADLTAQHDAASQDPLADPAHLQGIQSQIGALRSAITPEDVSNAKALMPQDRNLTSVDAQIAHLQKQAATAETPEQIRNLNKSLLGYQQRRGALLTPPEIEDYAKTANEIAQLSDPNQQTAVRAAIKAVTGRPLTSDEESVLAGGVDANQGKPLSYALPDGRIILTDAALARIRQLSPSAAALLPQSEQLQLENGAAPEAAPAEVKPAPKGAPVTPAPADDRPFRGVPLEDLQTQLQNVTRAIEAAQQRGQQVPKAAVPRQEALTQEIQRRTSRPLEDTPQAQLELQHQNLQNTLARNPNDPEANHHLPRVQHEIDQRILEQGLGGGSGGAKPTPKPAPKAKAAPEPKAAAGTAKVGDEIGYTYSHADAGDTASWGEVISRGDDHYRIVDVNDGTERDVPFSKEDLGARQPEAPQEPPRAAKSTAPAGTLPGVDPTKLSDRGRGAVGEVAKIYPRFQAMFEALGVKPGASFDLAELPNTFGLAINPRSPDHIMLDPEALADSLATFGKPQERQARLAAVLEEEAIHLAGEHALGEESDTTYSGIWKSLSAEQQEHIANRYGQALQEHSSANKGREYIRMLVQLDRSGRTTEIAQLVTPEAKSLLQRALSFLRAHVLRLPEDSAARKQTDTLVKRIQSILDAAERGRAEEWQEPTEADEESPFTAAAPAIGLNLNDVGKDFPVDPVAAPILKGEDHEALRRDARKAFDDWPQRVQAADGSSIRIQSPEYGSLNRRFDHLTQDRSVGFDSLKARWVPAIPETLKGAAVRLYDDRTNTRIYVRAYQGGAKHMVVVGPDGAVEAQKPFTGKLVTQFPGNPHGRQSYLKIEWIRKGGAPGVKAQPAETPRPGGGSPDSSGAAPSTELAHSSGTPERGPAAEPTLPPTAERSQSPVGVAASRPVPEVPTEENHEQVSYLEAERRAKQRAEDEGADWNNMGPNEVDRRIANEGHVESEPPEVPTEENHEQADRRDAVPGREAPAAPAAEHGTEAATGIAYRFPEYAPGQDESLDRFYQQIDPSGDLRADRLSNEILRRLPDNWKRGQFLSEQRRLAADVSGELMPREAGETLDRIRKDGIGSLDGTEFQKRLGAQLLDFQRQALQRLEGGRPAPAAAAHGTAEEMHEGLFGKPPRPTLREEVQPMIDAVVKPFTGAADDIARILGPSLRSEEAKGTAHVLRDNLAQIARKRDQAEAALRDASTYFAGRSNQENLDFIDSIENNRQLADPKLEAIAKTLRTINNERKAEVRNLPRGSFKNFIENYFPHIWEGGDVDGQSVPAKEFLRRIEGTKAFMKHRTIPTVADGIALGLKPLSYNPVDLMLLRWGQMDRYIAGQKILDELREGGMAKHFKTEADAPAGWVRIDKRIGTSKEWIDEVDKKSGVATKVEKVVPFYAPDSVAQILNNHLSAGLRDKAWYKGLTGVANVMNQVQLGFSAFHLGFTSFDAATSRLAYGLEQALRGNAKEAAKALVSVPVAPITNAMQGDKLLKEWMRPGSQGDEVAQLVDAVVKAGGRVQMDPAFSNHMWKAMVAGFRRGTPLGVGEGLMRAPFAAVEKVMEPIMAYVVPRQKLGIFADMARMEMQRLGPGATTAQLRAAMAKAWDSVDNRLGQVVYDNLFWNKVAKDLSHATIRSVGWNIGTFRELGGGGVDWANQVRKLATGRAKDVEFTHRMAYTIALPMLAGIVGALTQKMMTGTGNPLDRLQNGDDIADLRDLFFPKTGEITPDGHHVRISLPSYMKDVYAFANNPGHTVVSKLHPMWGMLGDMLQNKDFYGTEIRHADDPLLQQVAQELGYVGKNFLPFAVTGAKKLHDANAGPAKMALPFIGVTPAPAYIDQSPAEKVAAEIAAAKRPAGSQTQHEFAKGQFKGQLANQVRIIDSATASEDEKKAARNQIPLMLQKAVKDGTVTAPEASKAVTEVRKEAGMSPLQRRFKSLSYDEATRVWKVASKAEREALQPMMQHKMIAARERGEEVDPKMIQLVDN